MYLAELCYCNIEYFIHKSKFIQFYWIYEKRTLPCRGKICGHPLHFFCLPLMASQHTTIIALGTYVQTYTDNVMIFFKFLFFLTLYYSNVAVTLLLYFNSNKKKQRYLISSQQYNEINIIHLRNNFSKGKLYIILYYPIILYPNLYNIFKLV